MRVFARSAIAVVVVAASTHFGCSWTRFDEFKKDTPIFAFTNKAYGVRVGISADVRDGTAILGTGGDPGEGARFYALQDGRQDPSSSPLSNTQICELRSDLISAGKACLSGTTLPAVGTLVDSDGTHPGCFAVGFGKNSDKNTLPGPVVYCADGQVFTLRPPPSDTTSDAAPNLNKAFQSKNETDMRKLRIALASGIRREDSAPNPPLVLGDESDRSAFLYSSIVEQNVSALLVHTGTDTDRFGASVGVGRAEGTKRYYVVGAPGAASKGEGKIYLYTDGEKSADPPVHLGCAIDTAPGFGEVIAMGDVDADSVDDLLVTGGSGAAATVRVYLGKDRPKVAVLNDCAGVWPASTISLACAAGRGADGCAGADFGRSIAVGDLDKDGKPEVAVGAPGATADGVAGGGVVFLFTPLAAGNAVTDVRFLSRPEGGDAFGTSVAIGAVGGQETLAASSRGKNAAYVLWCTGLAANSATPRCRL